MDVFTANPVLEVTEGAEGRDLLQRARAGDVDAFSELCRDHEHRLFRHAVRLCGNETRAEELAQDAMVEAWKSLHRFKGRCEFFTWLCAILLNCHRKALRRDYHSSISSENAQRPANRLAFMPLEAAQPDEALQTGEGAALVKRCIQALPENQRHVIYLRFFVDESLESIAGALGCSVGTVKSRLFRALDKLRSMSALQTFCESSQRKVEVP